MEGCDFIAAQILFFRGLSKPSNLRELFPYFFCVIKDDVLAAQINAYE